MLKIPLYREDIRDRERAQLEGVRAAEPRREDVRLRVGSAVADLLERISSMTNSIELYQTGLIPQAESTFESAVAAYSTGELEFADLVLAEKSLLEVELGYHETVALYRQVVARLERPLGSADSDFLFPLGE
jgi:outer membrane protein TolC